MNRKKLTKENWGYIAGILDGEGSFTLRRQKSSRRRCFSTFVQVTSTDQKMLYFLKRKLGGGVYKHSQKYSIEHNRKPSWVWQLRRYKEVESLINKVVHLLLIKKKQAELLLRYIRLHWYSGLTAHDVNRYPKQLMRKELTVFLKLWDMNSRGVKQRKPIMPEAHHFMNLFHKCRLCKSGLHETKKKKEYIDISLCHKCHNKQYGYRIYSKK